MSADTRLKLGVALLIVGLVMPAGTVLAHAQQSSVFPISEYGITRWADRG